MKPLLFSLFAIGTTAITCMYANNLSQGDDRYVAGFAFFSALSGGSLVVSGTSIIDSIAERRKKS